MSRLQLWGCVSVIIDKHSDGNTMEREVILFLSSSHISFTGFVGIIYITYMYNSVAVVTATVVTQEYGGRL